MFLLTKSFLYQVVPLVRQSICKERSCGLIVKDCDEFTVRCLNLLFHFLGSDLQWFSKTFPHQIDESRVAKVEGHRQYYVHVRILDGVQ